MPKYSRPDAKLRKHLFLLAVIANIILPVITYFALQLWHYNIANDIMNTTLDIIIVNIQNVLDLIILYMSYGILINCLIRYGAKNSRPIILITVCGTVLHQASFYLADILTRTKITASILSSAAAYYCINLVIDCVRLLGAALLICWLRTTYIHEKNSDITLRKFIQKSNPLSMISLWIVLLIAVCYVPSIVFDLSNLDVAYKLLPFVRLLIKTAIGYVIIYFTSRHIEKTERNGKIQKHS